VGKEVSDVIHTSGKRLEEFNVKNIDDVRNAPENLVVHSDEVKRMDRQLKDFLYQNLYQHWRVTRMHLKAERFIAELFDTYINTPEILPKNIQDLAQNNDLHRTVCDYIAGMTDRFALKEHSKLFDPMEEV
jgi:dGTPase